MDAWGLSELRWIKPVYPSDLLKTKINVLEAKNQLKIQVKGTIRLQHTEFIKTT